MPAGFSADKRLCSCLSVCGGWYGAGGTLCRFPQLYALEDRKLFLKGRLLGWSGVVWNDELDIDCDTVYEEGIDVTDEYDDVILVAIGYNIKQLRIERRKR